MRNSHILYGSALSGDIAQLGERMLRMYEVASSNLVISTVFICHIKDSMFSPYQDICKSVLEDKTYYFYNQ